MNQQPQSYIPRQQLLQCRLCTDIFKKPITISCGHTFCYNCIYKFMKQHSQTIKDKDQYSQMQKEKQINKVQQKILAQEQQLFKSQERIKLQSNQNIPVPLCPVCSSLIWKPLKVFKQNLTISNLINAFGYKPILDFKQIKYEENIQNFRHKILVNVEKFKTDPLPYCFNEIHFKTCFIDDIQNQEPTSYIVIQWPSLFNQKIGLAGKILRVQESNHTHQPFQGNYKAYFYGLFFVKIKQVKAIQINLNSRFYTNSTFNSEQKFSTLTICTSQKMGSQNILGIEQFNRFFESYDTLNNPHYLSQVYQMIDQRIFLQRNNAEAMMYCCIRLLKIPQKQKREIIECFDDQIRMEKINNFLDRCELMSIDQRMNIKIPGKYNSNFVFGIIFLLILLHWYQN